MTNASKDQNHVSAKLAVLNTDGVTIVPIKINPVNGGMKVTRNSGLFFTMTPIAPRDDNRNACLLWEGTDGRTYPFVANSDGAVLIATN